MRSETELGLGQFLRVFLTTLPITYIEMFRDMLFVFVKKAFKGVNWARLLRVSMYVVPGSDS